MNCVCVEILKWQKLRPSEIAAINLLVKEAIKVENKRII